MSDEMFYLRSRHGDCGSNVMFHNKNGAGYGTDLDGLRTYSLEDAQSELNHDIAYTESAVDMIYTVTVSDITMRSDFNMIEARVKKSINLSRQDNATLLKDDTSWIRPNKTFHVR